MDSLKKALNAMITLWEKGASNTLSQEEKAHLLKIVKDYCGVKAPKEKAIKKAKKKKGKK